MHTTVSIDHIQAQPAPWRIGLLLATLLGFGSPALAQQSAARVMAVSGAATATDTQGRERPLEKGTELFSGDKVVTTEGALVQMRTHDGGYLSVRPGTALVIDRFVHDEKDANNSAFLLSLLRGGFRSITGLIGRTNPAGYQIRANTATIGIRGTDHEPMLVLDTPAQQTLGAPGLYDKVNDGETFIRNPNGVLSLKRGDVGFAPQASDIPPQVLLKIPDFYKLELKADARDAKDGADGKSDGRRAQPLRPSLAARREALLSGDGKAPAPLANPVTNPTTSPAPSPTIQPTTNPPPEITATPLTPEQKKAIILQGAPPPVQRTNLLNTAPTVTSPTAPTGTVLPK